MTARHRTWVDPHFHDHSEEHGIGTVVVLRRKNATSIEAGLFLVDSWCLGVRAAYHRTLEESELDEFREEVFPEGFVEKEGAWGRKMVEGAVAYARWLGFTPGGDYKKAARVFGGLPAADCSETFTFGKDGKPFYSQGPHHDDATTQRIINRLAARFGEDGFHYIVGSPFAEEAEEAEPDIPRYAEQSGGGEPLREMQAMIEEAGRIMTSENDALGDEILYDPGRHRFADYLAKIVELLILRVPPEGMSSVDLRAAMTTMLFQVLCSYVLERLGLPQAPAEDDDTAALIETAQELLQEPEMQDFIQMVLSPTEGIQRWILSMAWSEEEPSRLMVVYGEEDTLEDLESAP